MTDVSNPNMLLSCPDCNQPTNANQMMMGMPIDQQLAYMELPHAYSHSEGEILQSGNIQNQMSGGPLHSFSGFTRLEAIEEGREGPPSLESVDLVMYYDEPGFSQFNSVNMPNQNWSDSKVIAVDRNTKSPSTSQRLWSEASLNTSVPSRVSPILNEQLKNNATGALEVVIRPAASVHVNHVNLTEYEEEEVATPNINNTLVAAIDNRAYSEEFGAGQTTESEFCRNSALSCAKDGDKNIETNSSNDIANRISSNTSAVCVNPFPEFLGVDESSETLNMDKVTIGATKGASTGQRSWRRAKELVLAGSTIDLQMEASSSVTDNAASPVYVNHFADFVKLAMAGASTAKDILASASASTPRNTYTDESSSPINDSPHLLPAAFISRSAALVSPASASMSPGPTAIKRAPGLFAGPPPWVSVTSTLGEGATSSAWITVIKDGKDTRNADSARWALNKVARDKEDDFG